MQPQRFLAPALALALLLTGCSGSAGSGLPHTASPVTAKTEASLVIRIPHPSKKRGHYLSPSTQSLGMTVTPAGACTVCSPMKTNAGLTPGSPGCVDAAAGTTCTLALVLAPGTYVGSISTYDGPLAGGAPTGKVLSLDQAFPLTIASGQDNVANVTLSGVPASIQLVAASNNAGILTLFANPTNPIVVVAGGHARGRLEVLATDADGNIILGPGAPAFTATAGGGFVTSSSGNVIEITAPDAIPGFFALNVTSSSPGCAVTNCSWTGQIGFDSLLAIADVGNNHVVIQSTGLGSPVPVYATVTVGISQPNDVKFDAHGNLFVANFTGNTITEYSPPYGHAPDQTFSGLAGPSQIAIAPNGDLAVANSGAANVVVFPGASAAATRVTIPAAALAVAFDGAGNLWLARPGTTGIQRYPAPYTALNQTAAQNVSSPYSIAFDKGNNLFVANGGNGTITQYSSLSYGTAPINTATLAGVNNLSMAGGALLVACASGGVLSTYNTTLGSPQQLPSGTGTCHAVVDQMFSLWVSDKAGSVVYQYKIPYNPLVIAGQSEGLSQPTALDVFPTPASQ